MRTVAVVVTALVVLIGGVLWIERSGATNGEVSTLDARTKEALLLALDDERKAEATYLAVMERFGEVRPFSNIVRAEQQHERLVLALLEKYGIPVPANQYDGEKPVVPDTLKEACEAGIAGERANLEMYDRFLEFVAEEDIRAVFTKLRDDSQLRHLPAFERCASRSDARPGRGMGRGRGGNY